MSPTVDPTVLTRHTQKTVFRFPQGDPWGFLFSWGRLLDSAQGAIQVSLVPASGRPLPSSLPNPDPDLDHHPSLARRCIVMSLAQIDWQRVRGRLRSRSRSGSGSGLLWTGSLLVGLALGALGGFPGREIQAQTGTHRPSGDPIFPFCQPVQPPRPVQVMVHRALARQAPENTRPAITMCIADELEWVEIDVRLSKDGIHVLAHDDQLDGKRTDEDGSATRRLNNFMRSMRAPDLPGGTQTPGSSRPRRHWRSPRAASTYISIPSRRTRRNSSPMCVPPA